MRYRDLFGPWLFACIACFSIGVQFYTYTDNKALHNLYWALVGLITLALVAYSCVSVPQINKFKKEDRQTRKDLKNAVAFLEREDPILLSTFCDRHQLLRPGQCFELFIDKLSPENAKIIMDAFHKLVRKVVLSKNAQAKAINDEEPQPKE